MACAKPHQPTEEQKQRQDPQGLSERAGVRSRGVVALKRRTSPVIIDDMGFLKTDSGVSSSEKRRTGFPRGTC